jgi:aminocarboxymuconate-semialdehyde decarboxylase
VIRVQNESLAAFCASHSDRFAAVAAVALQFPDLAAQQLEHGMKTLGLRGVAVGGSVAGKELADPSFHPFWAKAEALGAVVFIHPQPAATPDLGNRLRGNGLLTNVIGNPLETTIALSHLIFEGTLDQFPGLKICAAHGGGYLPSYMNRSDHGCVTFPAQCKAGVPKEHPTTYVKRMSTIRWCSRRSASSSRRGGRRGRSSWAPTIVSVGRRAGRSCAGDARAGRRGGRRSSGRRCGCWA